MEAPRWVLNMNIDVLLCRIPPWSLGLWVTVCRRLSRAEKCPIVILLSDSSDNGLIGQWGDWLRKSQININTNILCITPVPRSQATELVGWRWGWCYWTTYCHPSINFPPTQPLYWSTNTDNHIETFYRARIQRIIETDIFISDI